MVKITKATLKDKKLAFEVTKDLTDWFDVNGLKNIVIDFDRNSVIVAKENDQVLGFICYTSYSGKWLLLWMGVAPQAQRDGIGQALLDWLVDEGKKLEFFSIEVETLPDEDNYEPYERTRSFYYKNGFERIAYKKARIEGWDDQIVLEKKL